MSNINFQLVDDANAEHQRHHEDIREKRRAAREAYLNSEAGANTKAKADIHIILAKINQQFVRERFNAEQTLLMKQQDLLNTILQSLS